LPGMMLGVGSVVDSGTTALYLQLGANFIVSPIMNPEMAVTCNRRKVLWSPGCGTLTEISRAHELGAEIVKIFPGTQVGGPGFVKAIKGPCPWASIMPTGGVAPTEENLRPWFDSGVTCVGMGSKLFPKQMIANGEFEALQEEVRKAVELIKEIRR
ncbi:MAG: bifunctional 4-hydroxy-2-oxoglutarate aldolase/2-dehydro-3-deoxy-phosphogluconate aldolase, partial [Bacteroidota bacterium]